MDEGEQTPKGVATENSGIVRRLLRGFRGTPASEVPEAQPTSSDPSANAGKQQVLSEAGRTFGVRGDGSSKTTKPTEPSPPTPTADPTNPGK